MTNRALIAALAAFLLIVTPLARGQVVQAVTGFSVDLNVTGGCRVLSPDSRDIARRMMPDVTCLGSERFNVARLASGGAVDAGGAPVTPMAAGQANTENAPTGAQVGNGLVWMVTF